MAEAATMHASIPNTPDDEAVIAVNLSKIRTAQESAASHHGSLRNVLKHAEGKGVHLKAAKKALAIVKAGVADGWLEETRETTRYLRILRHGIHESQLTLEFETTLAPIDEKAGLDGRYAGLDGADESTCPHDLSTKAGQAWLVAYRQGRAERELIMSMPETSDVESEANQEDDED